MKISNNKIYDKNIYIIKNFKDKKSFLREKYFYLKFKNKNINIPKLIKISKNKIFLKKYLYKKITSQKKFLNELLNFIHKINKVKNYSINAKENLKSFDNLYNQVKKRFDKLKKLKIKKNLESKKKIIENYIGKILIEEKKNTKLIKFKNFISQSDIGFHNCSIYKKKVFFYDFEYSGLDHPIKLICDTYYQPEKRIDKKNMYYFIRKFEKKFNFFLPKNFKSFERLLKAKMMLIILNVFFNSNIEKKLKNLSKKQRNKLKILRINKSISYIDIPYLHEKN